MEKQLIISVGREYGSGGHEIAQKLADHYGLPLYDHNLLDEMAEKKNLSAKELSAFDEKQKGLFFNHKVRGMSISPAENVAELQFKYLKEKAASGESFVIVGRCADSILRDRKNILNICIYAPLEARLQNCVKELGMDEDKALEQIKTVDEARAAYRRKHCPECTSEFDDRHLMIDSSRFGIEKTSEILTDIVKNTVAKD